MSELLTVLVEGFVALLELIARGIILLVSGSATLIAWVCSKAFRNRKRTQWKGNRVRKFAELGFSGLCVAVLVALGAWVLLREINPKPKSDTAFQAEKVQQGEDVRLRLQVTKDSQKNDGTIAVREGGTAKILGAKTLKDLKQQLAENVIVTDGQQNQTNLGVFPRSKPEDPVTDK